MTFAGLRLPRFLRRKPLPVVQPEASLPQAETASGGGGDGKSSSGTIRTKWLELD